MIYPGDLLKIPDNRKNTTPSVSKNQSKFEKSFSDVLSYLIASKIVDEANTIIERIPQVDALLKSSSNITGYIENKEGLLDVLQTYQRVLENVTISIGGNTFVVDKIVYNYSPDKRYNRILKIEGPYHGDYKSLHGESYKAKNIYIMKGPFGGSIYFNNGKKMRNNNPSMTERGVILINGNINQYRKDMIKNLVEGQLRGHLSPTSYNQAIIKL